MTGLVLAKLFVTIGVVLGLSIVAERISPRWAGILSGYPTGTAITLFFFGLEISPSFAAHSALYNVVGLVASQFFIYIYYRVSLKHSILTTLVLSILGYVIAIGLLHFIPLKNYLLFILPAVSIVVFTVLFKPIKNEINKKKIKLNVPTILLRGLAASVMVLLITSAARLIGPVWSGLFSSFPTTLLPLMLIVHLTYDTKHVHTIIKNVPIGNVALVLYSLTVALMYPPLGIYLGTAAALGAATMYLIGYQVAVQRIRTRI